MSVCTLHTHTHRQRLQYKREDTKTSRQYFGAVCMKELKAHEFFDWRDCWHGEKQADVKSPLCSFLVLAV